MDFQKFNHGLDITGKHIKENNGIIAIGPEGGWSTTENKFKYLSNIGDFTLRTETAPILGVSLLMKYNMVEKSVFEMILNKEIESNNLRR